MHTELFIHSALIYMRQMPPIRKNEIGFDYINNQKNKEEKKPFSIGTIPAAAIGVMIGTAMSNHQNKKSNEHYERIPV